MRSMVSYRLKEFVYTIGPKWDKLAPQMDAAIEFAHTHINPEPEREISPFLDTPESTLARHGEKISQYCREGDISQSYEEIYRIEKEIFNMVSSHNTDTDLVLYRGVSDRLYELMLKFAEDEKDCDLCDKGYMSTSLVKGQEIKCKIRLRIFVPKGARVVYLGNVNDEQHYYEVVIRRGAKLKIVSKDSTYINCQLLNP